VDGVTVVGASGGAAAEFFVISFTSNTVLAFSFTGATIPAGSGILVQVEVDGNADSACLSNVIFSDAMGNAIDIEVVDCLSIIQLPSIPGCMNEIACNYNVDATEDDGSCLYVEDCAGQCGGDAELDVKEITKNSAAAPPEAPTTVTPSTLN